MINQAEQRQTNIKHRTFVAVWRQSAFLVVLSLLMLLPLISSAFAAEDAKVKESMQTLKEATAALGKPKLEDEDLYFGTTKMNGDFTVVDMVKTKHNGTATLFAKKGANFVRVSTNVIKDGQRAVGTTLDPSGPAAAAIKQGQSFYGIVDILGKIYNTGYEPIKAENGDVIGVFYVGFLME